MPNRLEGPGAALQSGAGGGSYKAELSVSEFIFPGGRQRRSWRLSAAVVGIVSAPPIYRNLPSLLRRKFAKSSMRGCRRQTSEPSGAVSRTTSRHLFDWKYKLTWANLASHLARQRCCFSRLHSVQEEEEEEGQVYTNVEACRPWVWANTLQIFL